MANDPPDDDPFSRMDAARAAEKKTAIEFDAEVRKKLAESNGRVTGIRVKGQAAIDKARLESWPKK